MTEQEIKQKRSEFLEEMVAHFNSENRGINPETGNCSYEHGCAIGRKIADKELCKSFDSRTANNTANALFDRFPEELKILGGRFLRDCQKLHDDERAWDKEGITSFGQIKVGQIKDDYIL